jgi:hypothetical protein
MSKGAREPVGPLFEIDNEVTRRIRQQRKSAVC